MKFVEQILDRQRIRKAFDKAAGSYDEAAILQKEVCSRLLEKLDAMKFSPEWMLDAGTGTGEAVSALQHKYKNTQLVLLDLSERMLEQAVKKNVAEVHAVCGDIESLPFADKSFDLIFSNLALQWCNDVGAALDEFRRVLKPGGLLMFSTFGPDTLKELRTSWQKVDNAVHVNAFIDMHDIGDGLLQRGFVDPVMEAEMITVNYAEVDRLMQDLRAIGANATASGRRQGLLTTNMLVRLREAYEVFRHNGSLPASYEVVYGHAWVPDTNENDDSEGGQGVNVCFKD